MFSQVYHRIGSQEIGQIYMSHIFAVGIGEIQIHILMVGMSHYIKACQHGMLFRIIFSFRIISNNAATGIVAEVCHGRQPAHAQCRPYRSTCGKFFGSDSYHLYMDFVMRTGKIHFFFCLFCITGDADFLVSII